MQHCFAFDVILKVVVLAACLFLRELTHSLKRFLQTTWKINKKMYFTMCTNVIEAYQFVAKNTIYHFLNPKT